MVWYGRVVMGTHGDGLGCASNTTPLVRWLRCKRVPTAHSDTRSDINAMPCTALHSHLSIHVGIALPR